MPNASSMLVFVNEDGSVRELTEDDKEYVDAEFSPLDGNRPYVKSSYSDRNVSGRLRGYLPRAKVPPGVAIVAAPEQEASQPQTPQAVAKSLSELVGKHGRS